MLTSLPRSSSEHSSLSHSKHSSAVSPMYHILVPGVSTDSIMGRGDSDVKSIQVTLSASSTLSHSEPPPHQVDMMTIEQEGELQIQYPILDVTWTLSGQEFGWVDSAGTACIMNEKTKQLVESISLPTSSSAPSRILFNKQADKVLISNNKRVYVWDRKEGKWNQEIHASKKGAVSAMALHAEGHRLATGSTAGEVYTFNFKTNQYGLFKSSMNTTITDMSFSHFRPLFAAVGECGTLAVWDLTQKRDPMYEKLKAHQGPIRGVSFSPSNKDWFCTVGFDKMIKVHQITDKKIVVVLEINMGAPGTSLSLNADHTMAVGTSQGDVLLYKIGWKHPMIVKRLGYSVDRLSLSPKVTTLNKLSSSTSHPDLASIHRLSTKSLVSKRVASLGQEKNYMDMFSPVHTKTQEKKPMELKIRGLLFQSAPTSDVADTATVSSTTPQCVTADSSQSTPDQGVSPSQRRVGHPVEEAKTMDLTEQLQDKVVVEEPRDDILTPTGNPVEQTPVPKPSHPVKPISVLNARVSMPTPLAKTLSHVDQSMDHLHKTIVSEYAKRTEQEPNETPAPPNVPESESVAPPPAPSQFHYQVLENVIEESLHSFRTQIRNDVMNMHLEILRQFHIQKNELEALFMKYSPTMALQQEMQVLRQENDRLRKNY